MARAPERKETADRELLAATDELAELRQQQQAQELHQGQTAKTTTASSNISTNSSTLSKPRGRRKQREFV